MVWAGVRPGSGWDEVGDKELGQDDALGSDGQQWK